MTTQAVQVKLELGHRASLRRKPNTEGHTHDWTVFVRGPEGSNIQHFVEKVVFQLHESFPKPRRVVKDPPYQVSESGYGSFQLPIEIYFKNREDPRKICFDYDLFLHLEGSPPVNHTRCEKLTFQGPNEDFRRKLIMAGGVGVLTPGNSPAPQPAVPPPGSGPDTPESSKTFNDLFGAPIKAESKKEKHSKSRTNGSSGGSGSVSLSQSYPSMGSGSSSKDPARLSSSSGGQISEKPHKEKPKRPSDFSHSGSGKKSGELNFPGMGKSSPSLSKRPNESSPSVNSKNSPSVPGKPFPSLSSKRPSDSSPTVALKRLPELAPSPSESSYKKKKRESDSGSAHKSKHKEKERERGKSSHSSKDRGSSSSSKHKSSKDKKSRDEEPKVKQEKRESSEQQKSKSTPSALPKSSVPTAAVIASKPISETKTKAALRPFEDELSTGEQSEFDPFEDDDDDDAEPVPSLVPPSLSKTIQPPSLSRSGKQPLNRLLSQLESEDSLDDDDILSPMSRTSPPALFQQSQRSASPHIPSHLGGASKDKRESLEQSKKSSSSATKPEKSKSSSMRKPKEKRSKDHRRQQGNQDKESSRDSRREQERREKEKETAEECKQDSEKENRGESTERSVGQDPNLINHDREMAPNGEDLAVLLELQQRLMTMTDRQLLQRVVSVIEESGMYKIGDATFDFDLCSLDRNTVGRIKTCLEAMSTQC